VSTGRLFHALTIRSEKEDVERGEIAHIHISENVFFSVM